jgi:uncharacterized protein YndB with AHSA1/START domain
MAAINNTIDIKATPDEVWAVLADMPATRQWLPGVVAARMEGDVRICEMADGQQVREKSATSLLSNAVSGSSTSGSHYRCSALAEPSP